MSTHVLAREQTIAQPLQRVFAFFADAHNLEAITPPWLRFRVLTPAPIEMRTGALIAYRMRLRGVPIRWLTRIEQWEPQRRFLDAQLRGPYRLWRHTHTFEASADGAGTVMRDRVEYALAFGPLGDLVEALFVRAELARIFDYRAERISGLLA